MNARTKANIVDRLRKPIDPSQSVIQMHTNISNIGLRMVADKLDAIGEALAVILDDKVRP